MPNRSADGESGACRHENQGKSQERVLRHFAASAVRATPSAQHAKRELRQSFKTGMGDEAYTAAQKRPFLQSRTPVNRVGRSRKGARKCCHAQ